MKIKRGSILTVLLAMLCAVALALGISFLLPKAEKVDANAYVDVLGTPTIIAGTSPAGFNISSGWSTSTIGVTAGNGISMSEASASNTLVSGNYPFSIKITVPAYTQYKAKYRIGMTAGLSSPTTGSSYTTGTLSIERYKDSSYSDFKEQYGPYTWTAYHGGAGTFIEPVDTVDNLIFANNTGSPQDFYTYYILKGAVTAARGGWTQALYAAGLCSDTTVEITKLPVPATTDTLTLNYDGNSHNVNFTYADVDTSDLNSDLVHYAGSENVNVTLDAKGYDNLPISPSDYSFSASNGSGTLTATKAGTYKITFNIKPTATSGITFDDGSTVKTMTLKINRIGLSVPSVSNTTQTYNPSLNGCYFGVSSDFDATTMDVVTAPAPTTELEWNVTNTRFEAKKAGTYTVKFQLKDKVNYCWDIGANGTTDDQPVTLQVDKKTLTVPTITATQEYTGTPLTFSLANFNAGQYISMDGVTATKSSNTVTYSSSTGETVNDKMDTFEAKNVDTYTVRLSLRDTTNYVWADGSISAKPVDFEITPKELITTAIISNKPASGGAEWEFGDSTATIITVTDDRVSGDNISLLFYYDNPSNTLTGTTVGNITTISMPSTIAAGDHTFRVELNGDTGDNANYKITLNLNDRLSFKVKSGKLDPSTYDWEYTKDGAAGGTIANDGSFKVPFELKSGSTTDGVKYEVSIKIPSADTFVIVDTSKYTAGYLTRSGNSVNTYTTTVALKSTDTNNLFEVSGVMQDTCEVEFKWEIEKGTFNLSGVKWEYSLNGSTGWTDYNPANPPQYNDGYNITVRVKASTLPRGLTLDALYTGSIESAVNNYTATISKFDFNYDTNNFNDPDTSLLDLNWDIVKKNLYKNFKNIAEPFTNVSYSGNIIIKQLDLDPTYAGYIDYTYYELPSLNTVTLQDIKDAVDLTNPKNYKVEASIKSAYAANYEVTDSGATPSAQFTTGSSNKLANAAIDNATVEYDGNTHFGISHVTVTGSDSMNVTDFTVKYYKGTTPVAANALAAGELPKDAGDYCIEVILGSMAESTYILVTDRLTVTIEAKAIPVPVLGEMTFNGKEQNFADNLSGASWTTYGPAGMNIIKVDGKISDRNVGASNYVTTLELTDSNYKWLNSSTASPTKAVVKYSLAADEVKPAINGDCTIATYNWNIKPLIVDTTNMWNKGKKGATLKLPQNIKDLIAGGTLEVGYRYYEEGVFVEEPELKSGKSFNVEAVFGGDDSVRNVQFKQSDTEFGATSKSIDYTVPTSGAAVFFGKVKDFMTSTAAGLPVWAWFLIALALLILLIVIIVVCVKRRKTKEEREEKKALKEEERMRREEERQRREEEREAERQRREDERRMQQEKLEAERELARVKQEAELEKIRAQAQAGMAGASMATMAMAQQPQQQAMPVQQAQTVDNNALARIEAEIAQINQKIANQQPAQPQFMPVPVQQQMQPQYYPVQQMPMMQMPMMPQYGGGVGGGEYSDLRADVRSMREEQRSDREVAALKKEMELEFAKMRIDGSYGAKAPQLAMPANMPADQDGQPAQGNSAEVMGAIMAAFVKNMAMGNLAATSAEPVQEPQTEEKPNVANTSASYPSNAVITTTTTVDTTKGGSSRTQSDDGRLFDIDGFYDTFEGNK